MTHDHLTSPDLPLLGILGGMTPESTADYYRRINDGVRNVLGGHHSARLLIYSANLEQAFHWMSSENDEALAHHLVEAALGLQAAGAEALLVACNTAHKVAPAIESVLNIPFLHIADALGSSVQDAGLRRVALLGSQITAEAPFYRERLQSHHGIEAIVPGLEGRREVDRIIREELAFHTIHPESLHTLEDITVELRQQGAEAVALACTELVLLVDGSELGGLPVFDSTTAHAERAVQYILDGSGASSQTMPAAPALASA